MSKKKSSKKVRGKYKNAPVYAPASKGDRADRGFPCVRCGAPLSSPADQHQHNVDTHLDGPRP